MPCEGTKNINVTDICHILSKIQPSMGDQLLLFHDKLEAGDEGIKNHIQNYKSGILSLYEVLNTILSKWILRHAANATVDCLRSAFLSMDMQFQADILKKKEFKVKYKDIHICRQCKVIANVEKPIAKVKPQQQHFNNEGPQLTKEYAILRRLGSGGFGVVLECQHNIDMKQCAIKVVPGKADEGMREVQNHVKIPDHPNIVQYKGCWKNTFRPKDLQGIRKMLRGNLPEFMTFGENAKTLELLCIKMELCGGDLREWMGQQDSVDEPKVTNMFTQIILGIQHIHKQQLIHRDIKPENIFFDMKNASILKIGDMGIAVSHETAQSSGHSIGVGATQYLAPEQKGDTYGPLVDIYSAGIILMELLHPEVQPVKNNNCKNPLSNAINLLLLKSRLPQPVLERFPKHSDLIIQMVELLPKDRPDCETILQRIQSMGGIKSDENANELETETLFQTGDIDEIEDSSLIQLYESEIVDTDTLSQAVSETSDPENIISTESGSAEAKILPVDENNNASEQLTKSSSEPAILTTITTVRDSVFNYASSKFTQYNIFKSNDSTETSPSQDQTSGSTDNASSIGSTPTTENAVGEQEVPDRCSACNIFLNPRRFQCNKCPTVFRLCKSCYKDPNVESDHKKRHDFNETKPAQGGYTAMFGSLMRSMSGKN